MFSSSPDHFRPHDSLNLPTFIHISLLENTEPNHSINFPFALRLEDPTLERVAVKKLKCVEKGYAYPHIDIVFARGETSLTRVGVTGPEKDESNCGYVIFAYKTMEHMHTQKFTSSWKTWSGARMLSTRMPLPHIVTKMSFFKKVSGQLNFEYILIAKIKNMMVNAAPALNVLHYMKPKVCAYVGAYRKISFEVSKSLCRSLGLIDANYVDALTNRFRVTYSNNTGLPSELRFVELCDILGYVELSNFIEFRCKAEEEEAREAKDKHIRKSTHVQTEPTESSRRARRTLPRTLPSTPNTTRSPSTPFQFYPTYPSPNSVIGSILQHRSQIVTVGNNYLLVLDNRNSEAPNETVINGQMPCLPKTVEHKTQHFPRSRSHHCHSNNSNNETSMIQNFPKPPEDDGALLRHLKTKYFNSEEYTSAEFCEHVPK
ncbi:hypothetical protein CAEBREN_20647 [Caenorhabditis brenneri]|uniref:DUF7153 domain-containing protein n=1 Tax=Caenorhabditis brenneri TaxID=135651 RepID=G0M7S8_CAEBE|nr:hypothetical protein CAEBREN_20647 [Caenorhabditis brenneri]